MTDSKLKLGVIVGAHGVRGQVRVISYTEDPRKIGAYGALTDASGRRSFKLKVNGDAGGQIVATLEGVTDRNAAEALKGTELFIERAALPAIRKKNEWYVADLVGMDVHDLSGKKIGTALGVHHYGAGNVLEVQLWEASAEMYPFACVDSVDTEKRVIVIDPPEMI